MSSKPSKSNGMKHVSPFRILRLNLPPVCGANCLKLFSLGSPAKVQVTALPEIVPVKSNREAPLSKIAIDNLHAETMNRAFAPSGRPSLERTPHWSSYKPAVSASVD